MSSARVFRLHRESTVYPNHISTSIGALPNLQAGPLGTVPICVLLRGRAGTLLSCPHGTSS